MGKTCFLSYARANIDVRFKQFLKDLRRELQTYGGPEFDDVLFRDMDHTRWGETWDTKIADAVKDGDALLALYSPHFFKSSWCSRELGLFLQRRAAAPGDPPAVIVPVFWVPVTQELIPEALRTVNWEPEGLPRAYLERGLYGLVHKAEFDRAYGEVIYKLAHAIIHATGLDLPKLDQRPDLRTAPTAWPEPSAARPDPERRPIGGPDTVTLLCLVGTEADMQKLEERKHTDCYGRSPELWKPFRKAPVYRIVDRVAESCQLDMLEIDALTPELEEELLRAKSLNAVIAVVIDPWALYDERFDGVARAIDEVALFNACAVAPMSADEETTAKLDVLRAKLELAFPNKVLTGLWRLDDAPVRSQAALEEALRQGLLQVRQRLLRYGNVRKRTRGVQSMPQLRGPGETR